MTNTSSHTTLATGRWHNFTLATQLGNIGSEFERASRALQTENAPRFRSAIDRRYERLALSACDPKFSLVQRREITRLRESISETFLGTPKRNCHAQDYSGTSIILGWV